MRYGPWILALGCVLGSAKASYIPPFVPDGSTIISANGILSAATSSGLSPYSGTGQLIGLDTSGSVVAPTLKSLSYTAAAGSATLAPFANYTVAALPTVTSANQGLIAYATNCRANASQGASAGHGCLVTVDSTGIWVAVWSGVAPTT